MSAFIAIGAVVLAVGWLLWEFWRAPEMDEPEPIRTEQHDDFEMGVLLAFDSDRVPHERRYGL